MKRTHSYLFCLFLLALPLTSRSFHDLPVPSPISASSSVVEDDLAALQQKIRAKLTEMREVAGFPGVTVAFVLPDGRSGSVSVGLSDTEKKTPLAPNDRMLAGSIGKTFVAGVTLQLVQEGKLDLDAKIERRLGKETWFPRLPNAQDITLRMLMNHSSGIPEHVLHREFNAALKKEPDRVWKPEELVAYILDHKPLFPAGQGWSYADTNYILVGMIVERVTGKPLYEEVQRRLLDPLKLSRIGPSDRRTIPGLIAGYSQPNSPFGFEGSTLKDGRFVLNPQFEWAGGGFASTPLDLARWARALYEGKTLKSETLRQMLTGVEAKTGRGDKYGLGVQIRQTNWGLSYGHGGWFPGYLSEMEYFPEKKTAIAIQFNTDNMRQLRRSPHAYIAEMAKLLFEEGVGCRTG